MPSISQDYWAHSGNYSPGGNSCEYIVIHMTGNTASALNEAKYAHNNRHDSSYHYVLDGGGVIYQILWDSDTAWSVGAWSGATQYIRNNQTINIEVCNNGGPFDKAEIEELAWLVPQLMAKWGIDEYHVVRHWDCHSGHKSCPSWYSGYYNTAWNNLRDYITGGDMTFDEFWYTNLGYSGGATWGPGGPGRGGGNPTPYNLFYNLNIAQGEMLDKLAELEEKVAELERPTVDVDIDYDQLTNAIAEKVANVIAKRMME